MQWIGKLLMILGVSAGCYGAMTAYHAPIDAPDAEISGLTLNDSAGARLDETGAFAPIATQGEKLDRALMAKLRENTSGIPGRASAWRYVRVKEFSWSRWPGKWYFAIGTFVLLVGALLARSAREVVEPTDDGSVLRFTIETLGQLVGRIEALRALVESQRGGVATMVCDTTDELQRRWITPLLRGQSSFVAKHGIGRAAETLTSLAGVERYLNRAWSAAADGYLDEALEALRIAERHCQTTRNALASLEESR